MISPRRMRRHLVQGNRMPMSMVLNEALPESKASNRFRVQTQWLWSYLTGQRSSLLIGEAP